MHMQSPTPTPPSPAFQFPREYFFPPFFTRQTNLTTHHAQLVKWSTLVLAYCQHHRLFKLSLSGRSTTAQPQLQLQLQQQQQQQQQGDEPAAAQPGTEELFHNKKIGRRLSVADAREVVEFMRKDGRAEYVGGGSGGDVVWVYWRTPEEWAALVEAWVDDTAQKGTVLTLYELTDGDATLGTEFHGLDPDLLQKALNLLVKRGKAQVFGQEDSRGVKFF